MKEFTIFLLTLFSLSIAALGQAPSAEKLLQQQIEAHLESAALEGSEVAAFKTALLANNEWQHQLCDAGSIGDSSKVLLQLFTIWKADKKLTDLPINQAMATACALEGPRKKRSPEESLQRYQFFKAKHEQGLLNSMYDDLSMFQRRYLASGVQHSGFNSIDSMEYFINEVCLPSERYTGACWYAAYQLHTPFGDSIHGPHYYAPYANCWKSKAEMVRKVGGVCGSLSNFGAAAAVANGVPASSMGEPGHCAYTVMTKLNQWTPAYSLSWKRGLHTSYHGGSWGWHMLHTKFHENWDNAKKSADLRRLAKYYISKNTSDKARATIQKARQQFPSDWQNWQFSIDVLKETKSSDQHWQALHKDIINHLSPISGEISYHFLDNYIYPKVLPKGEKSFALRKKVILSYQHSVKDWGIARWDYNSHLSKQLKLLAATPKQQDEFMAQLFNLHAKNNIFTPTILETQLKNTAKDVKRQRQFIASISKGISNGGEGEFSGVIRTLAKKILPQSAKRGDKSSFQFIGKLTADIFDPVKVKVDPFPGILLSSGGTFSIQSPGNRWDDPSRHWGVIEPHGGDFHTSAQKPTATIQLGNFGKISGVNIVTRGGQFQRLVGAILQVSENNKDWTDVHTFKVRQRIHRVDLTEKKLNAGYVRVIQPNSQPLHFNLFHVYGKKQN